MMRFSLMILGLVVIIAVPAQAWVDLEWRVETQNHQPGDVVRIGLYAVSDNNGGEEPFTLSEVIMQWDPDYLALLGVDDNGPYSWGFSGFMADSGLDGLNETFEDGDADYQAWANGSALPVATTDGLLITTFEFEALAASDGTNLEMLTEFGYYSVTAIYDDLYGGWNIIDDIDSAVITIDEGGLLGDLDGDGDVDIADLAQLISHYGETSGMTYSDGDLDGDGDVDISDLAVLLANYGS